MSDLQYPVLDSLIAQFEGFGKDGVPATRNNNPGNIVAGTFATSHGATGSSGPFAVFPDSSTGLAATDALVSHYADMGFSIEDLINKWAPPTAPGNSVDATQNYINFVSGKLGQPATDPIKADSKSMLPDWLYTIVHGEYPNLPAKPAVDPALAAPPSALSVGRIAAFLLGLILIAGGLYLFKPVQEVVNSTVKGAAVVA